MNLLNSDLQNILLQNDTITQEKFLNKIVENMSEADGEGHVYGYIPKNSKFTRNNFLMKLGRTQKYNPEDRISEWGGKLVFSVRTICNRKLERLVHIIFKKWHFDVFNNLTQKKEIEWFRFNENIKVATIVNMINDIMSDMHMEKISVNPSELTISETTETTILPNQFSQTNQLSPTTKININNAPYEELIKLTGIADKLARRIIEFRESERFTTIEDIMKVPYIKHKVFDKCKNEICV